MILVALWWLGGPVLATTVRRDPLDYQARTFAGKPVCLGNFRGNAVLLHAWASYCQVCRSKMPQLQHLAERFRSRGLVVIGVNLDGDDDLTPARNYLAGLNLTYPMWRDTPGGFAATFRYVGVPQLILLDRRGQLIKHWLGAFDAEAPATLRLIERAVQP